MHKGIRVNDFSILRRKCTKSRYGCSAMSWRRLFTGASGEEENEKNTICFNVLQIPVIYCCNHSRWERVTTHRIEN
jgi:hypothetical protein